MDSNRTLGALGKGFYRDFLIPPFFVSFGSLAFSPSWMAWDKQSWRARSFLMEWAACHWFLLKTFVAVFLIQCVRLLNWLTSLFLEPRVLLLHRVWLLCNTELLISSFSFADGAFLYILAIDRILILSCSPGQFLVLLCVRLWMFWLLFSSKYWLLLCSIGNQFLL